MWEAVEDKRPGWGSSACWLHFRLGLCSHGVMLLKLRGPNIFLLKFSIKNKTVQQRRRRCRGPWSSALGSTDCQAALLWEPVPVYGS